MSFFPDTIEQILEGGNVKATWLVLFDFDGAPMRVWAGIGILPSGGEDWSGLGELGSIEGIEQAVNGEAPVATFSLSGVDPEILASTGEDFRAEAKGRNVIVYMQFFNEEDDRPLTTFDEPYAVWQGRMQDAAFSIGSKGERSIRVTAESLFGLRSRPNFSMYTDRDQEQRFAGDRGFAFTHDLVRKVVTWPDY